MASTALDSDINYSTWSYVIPPYLLNTCYGGQMKNAVIGDNPALLARNVVPCLAINRTFPRKSPRQGFSQDPKLNSLIFLKLAQYFSISGVFGQKPSQSILSNEEQLLQYYDMFEDQIMSDLDYVAKRPVDETIEDDRKYLESDVPPEFVPLIPKPVVGASITNPSEWSLKDLLRYVKELEWTYNVMPPGLRCALQTNLCAVSSYTLPVSWSPLFLRRQLANRHPNLEMDIFNVDGFLNLVLASKPIEGEQPTAHRAKPGYFNFVADTTVQSSVGVFYYEVEIKQTCTQATLKTPIIQLKDNLLTTDVAICLSLGYCRSSVRINNLALSNRNTPFSSSRLPLDLMRREMLHDRHQFVDSASNYDPASMLGNMPGEFEGSYAINLEDLTFLNSSKNSDVLARPNPNSFGRRYSSLSRNYAEHMESTSTDMGVKFDMKITKAPQSEVYTSSCVGVGINFIEKTIFFTLDGVMIKTFLESDLKSSNTSNTLFNKEKHVVDDTSISPMLGFKINELPTVGSVNEPSRTIITTNFGHREFRFDMNRYTQALKASRIVDMKRDLQKASEGLAQGSTPDMPSLDQLVREYLNFRGYFKTLESYETDCTEFPLKDGEPLKLVKDDSIYHRAHLKQLCYGGNFDAMVLYLREHFTQICEKLDMLFRIKHTQFEVSLDAYIRLIVHPAIGGAGDTAEEVLATTRGHLNDLKRFKEYREDPRVRILAPLLLVKDSTGLENLPQARSLIGNSEGQVRDLFQYINGMITTMHMSRNNYSALHDLVNDTGSNIAKLGCRLGDTKFALVNYEDDWIS